MAEYIDKQVTIKKILGEYPEPHYPGWYADIIKDMPVLDISPVVHSMWGISCDGYYQYCKNCKTQPKNGELTKFCPNCGAKMDGAEDG